MLTQEIRNLDPGNKRLGRAPVVASSPWPRLIGMWHRGDDNKTLDIRLILFLICCGGIYGSKEIGVGGGPADGDACFIYFINKCLRALTD